MSVAVVVVGAGRGRRLGGEVPKQYLPLAGPCALRRCIETFLAVPAIDAIVPVIHPDDEALCRDALDGLDHHALREPVPGAETRASSVRRGLEALAADAPGQVLIHDAARPFVPLSVVTDVIAALRGPAATDGACAALRVVDTIWRAGEDVDTPPQIVSREGLWRAQTPQGFDFAAILGAHRAHDNAATDDVAVAVAAGLRVRFVPGSEQNYKITGAADLERAIADAKALDGVAVR